MYATFHIRNHVRDHFLTHAKDCDVYSLWKKTSLCATFWLIWTCPHANFLMRGRVCIQLVQQFPMFETHRNDFVTQKVSRHRSFSVWTRAWTRLVVDTLRGNMSVEPKHMKLWDKLYTNTSSHEKICMRTRPYKSKRCAEESLSQWIHITVLRVGQTNDIWHDFVCEKLHTYTSSYVNICTWGRPRKSK